MYTIYADNMLLYSPQAAVKGNYGLISPSVEYSELGNAGSFSFTIPIEHPRYNHLNPMKTFVSVLDGDSEVFRGRILTAESDFFCQKNITCEGDLVVLKDSPQKPGTMSKSIRDLFVYYITQHNAWAEKDKRFEIGEITIDNADTIMVTVENTEYRKTRDAIDNDLISVYGGYLRTRTTGGKRYIDYLKEYGRTSTQVLRFGDNIIDLSQCVSAEDVFSIVIGYGDDSLNIASVNNGSDEIEIPGAVEKWGRIVRIEQFSGVTDPNTLKAEINQFIKTHYSDKPKSITITAVDLKRMGVDVTDIQIGDRVLIYSKPHGLNDYYVCISVSYDIVNPGNTTYTFGRSAQTLSKKYAQSSQQLSETSNAVGRVGSGLGATQSRLEQYIIATDDTLMLQHQNIVLNAKKIQANAEQIALKAERTYVDGVATRLSLVEIDLNGDNTTLGLKAQLKTVIDDAAKVEQRVSGAELLLNGAEGTAGLVAQVDELNKWQIGFDGELTELSKRMGSAELTLNGSTGTAGLVGRMTTVEKQTDDLTKQVVQTITRVSSAELILHGDKGQAGLIARMNTTEEGLEGAKNNINTVAINLDAANATLQQTVVRVSNGESNFASLKMYVDEDLTSAIEANADNITANANRIKANAKNIQANADAIQANARDIELNATNVVTINSQITNINSQLANLPYTDATKISTDEITVSGDAWVKGTTTLVKLSTGSITFGGSAVSKTTIPVVTAFTQASGEKASTTNYTILTTAAPSAVARQPAAGTTITDFANL